MLNNGGVSAIRHPRSLALSDKLLWTYCLNCILSDKFSFLARTNRSVTDFLLLDTALTKCPRAALFKPSLSNVLKKEAKENLVRNSDRANLSL